MKLLVCTYEYFPHGSGIANVVHNVVRELEMRGVDCTVCSPTGPDIKLGSKTLIAKTAILGFLDFWLKVSRLDLGKYDAVWLNQPMSLKKLSHKNLIVTVHTTYLYYNRAGYHPKPYYSVSARIEKYCIGKFGRNTKFVAINDSIFEEVRELGIPRKRINLIPNGVFTKRFALKADKKNLRKKLGLPQNKKIILSVGRITEQKQPHKLMEFFSLLEKNDNDFFLVLGGKGELMESTKDKAKELGIKNILFLGYVPEEDIPPLYLCSDYYILLSLYEALPLTLLDAMAAGLPSLVTDIPGMAVVKNDKCGIIVDVNKMDKGIKDFLAITPKEYLGLSKNAKKSAQQFDWSNIAKSYLKVIESGLPE